MSGSGVGETPSAAFAALSARVLARADGSQGLSSSISESQGYLDRGDDKAFTESLDRRCRALDGQGLMKPGKITPLQTRAKKNRHVCSFSFSFNAPFCDTTESSLTCPDVVRWVNGKFSYERRRTLGSPLGYILLPPAASCMITHNLKIASPGQ